MDLTGKQKRHLRGLGQSLTPAVIIGKAGLSDQLVRQLSDHLDRAELIKIKLPPGPQRKSVSAEAAEKLGAICIGIVGRTALLYRANQQLDSQQRVRLPG